MGERMGEGHTNNGTTTQSNRAPGGAGAFESSVLCALYAHRSGLSVIAKRHGFTLDALAAWTGEPSRAQRLRELRRLGDARAALVLSRVRAEAATTLLGLAKRAESEETRRKACVDLLGMDAPTPPDDADDPPLGEPDEDEFDAATLRAFVEAFAPSRASPSRGSGARPENDSAPQGGAPAGTTVRSGDISGGAPGDTSGGGGGGGGGV